MLSFGLTFIAVNVLYILFSVLMGFIAYKLYKLKKVGFIIFLIVLILPFYDLLIQKGIKTYYETFKMDNTIYAYPERDENGKIESLGIGENVAHSHSGYLSGIKDFIQLKKSYAVDSFLECYMSDSFAIDNNGTVHYDYNNDLGYVRVNLTEKEVKYRQLRNETEYKSRYQILGNVTQHLFYTEKEIYFKDVKNDVLLAKGFKIIFSVAKKNAFRNKYLLWQGPSGVAFSISSIGNYGKFYQLLAYNNTK